MKPIHKEGFWTQPTLKLMLQPGAIRNALLQDSPTGKLYSYKPWNQYTRDVLENGMLWCSTLDKFNDPFEGTMSVSLPYVMNIAKKKRYASLISAFTTAIPHYLTQLASNPQLHTVQILTHPETLPALNDDARFLLSQPEWDNLTQWFITSYNINAYYDALVNTIKELFKNPMLQQRFHVTAEAAELLINTNIPTSENWDDLFQANDITEDMDDFQRAEELLRKSSDNSEAAETWHNIRKDIANTNKICSQLFAVSCLTISHQHPLMWAHYSQNYTGVCIEFDYNNIVTDNMLPLPVEYSNKRPMMPKSLLTGPSPKASLLEVLKIVLTKNKAWEYEKEWRVLQKHEGYHVMPPITCVYLGCNFPEEAKKEVIKIAKSKGFCVKQMALDTAQYTFHFQPLSENPTSD